VIATPRRVLAEAVGTGFLVGAVVGSGIAAQRLSPDDAGLQLLENSLITGAALIALILALQPVSAAFNPVITLLELGWGQLTGRAAAALIAAQIAGGATGAVAANLMFDLHPVSLATQHRGGGGVWLGEAIATLGLALVIFGAARGGRSDRIAYAVGAYISAAYWFTSSTSFANPAVTLARTLSDTFTGIAPASAPMFIGMQFAGAAAAYLLIGTLYPASSTTLNPSSQAVPGEPAPTETKAIQP
jgi:glycerol uptake facilitator-like aquaporin